MEIEDVTTAALRHIWKIVADAEKANRRLTKNERLNIMQWCAAGLNVNVHSKAGLLSTEGDEGAEVVRFPSKLLPDDADKMK